MRGKAFLGSRSQSRRSSTRGVCRSALRAQANSVSGVSPVAAIQMRGNPGIFFAGIFFAFFSFLVFFFMQLSFYDKRQLIGCRGACSALSSFSRREDTAQVGGELLREGSCTPSSHRPEETVQAARIHFQDTLLDLYPLLKM